MLTIDPDKVCFIIIKARAFDAKVDVVEPDPGSNASDEDMREVLEDYSNDATLGEVKDAIESLNEDEQIELVALAWLGRDDFTAEEWADARERAADAHNSRTAEYLLGIPLLGDYLEEGLAMMGHSCEDFERGHL